MNPIDEAFSIGIIDDYEYCLLSESGREQYGGRKQFDLEKHTSAWCVTKFRFRKEDIKDLVGYLNFPPVVILDNRINVM